MTAERAKEYFEKAGQRWSERAITGSGEVQAATQSLSHEADAIYVPIDSTVLSAMPQVTAEAKKAGIPVCGSAPSMVEYNYRSPGAGAPLFNIGNGSLSHIMYFMNTGSAGLIILVLGVGNGTKEKQNVQ